MVNYKFIKRLSEKIVVLESEEYGQQLWTMCRIRANKECYISGLPLKGRDAFRPIGSEKNNRMERLSIDSMRQLEIQQ